MLYNNHFQMNLETSNNFINIIEDLRNSLIDNELKGYDWVGDLNSVIEPEYNYYTTKCFMVFGINNIKVESRFKFYRGCVYLEHKVYKTSKSSKTTKIINKDREFNFGGINEWNNNGIEDAFNKMVEKYHELINSIKF